MDKLGMQMYMMLQWVKRGFRDFVEEERGAVDIVAIVVLIGIAVALALIFREGIQDLIETLLATITGNATKAIA